MGRMRLGDDLDLMDELLDEGFALGRGATLEDVIDVIGQRVEFVARAHRGCLVEQSDQFVAAGLQLFRLGPECRQPVYARSGDTPTNSRPGGCAPRRERRAAAPPHSKPTMIRARGSQREHARYGMVMVV